MKATEGNNSGGVNEINRGRETETEIININKYNKLKQKNIEQKGICLFPFMFFFMLV